jgi:tetratricopeptide (TPR) repeat protein
LTSRWQISAGEITEWLPPLLFAFAALASAWVLHDARSRFAFYAVAAWTLATLIYTPVVLPLYLIARMFKPHPVADADATQPATPAETDVADPNETRAADAAEMSVPGATVARVEIPDGGEHIVADPFERVAAETPQVVRLPFRIKRYALPLLYALVLVSAGAFYFYRDYHSFDAHLARAANARLLNHRDAVIREYRAALRISDDAHTHKLLALQLAEDGQTEAALSEFRAAERGGEPDEHLPLRIASALDALGRAGEADEEYRKFLQSSSCVRPSPDTRCAGAAARVGHTTHSGVVVR